MNTMNTPKWVYFWYSAGGKERAEQPNTKNMPKWACFGCLAGRNNHQTPKAACLWCLMGGEGNREAGIPTDMLQRISSCCAIREITVVVFDVS